eukprot:CAMPEP_0117543898 /NCGR_PEP_ID=MMETSP0784-20121206/45295_1 /TAXON_ID=39447 /ORGANISM="" /LENGTH=292 /DNA_ID=CAMNT_0005340685 /DNA_START=412 /DNA_END=1290 /DNA_ORIENTATION=-
MTRQSLRNAVFTRRRPILDLLESRTCLDLRGLHANTKLENLPVVFFKFLVRARGQLLHVSFHLLLGVCLVPRKVVDPILQRAEVLMVAVLQSLPRPALVVDGPAEVLDHRMHVVSLDSASLSVRLEGVPDTLNLPPDALLQSLTHVPLRVNDLRHCLNALRQLHAELPGLLLCVLHASLYLHVQPPVALLLLRRLCVESVGERQQLLVDHVDLARKPVDLVPEQLPLHLRELLATVLDVVNGCLGQRRGQWQFALAHCIAKIAVGHQRMADVVVKLKLLPLHLEFALQCPLY